MLAAAGVGLSIAAPIGPTSMLCVQRTLAAGLSTGLATGLGVATVHLAYGALVLAFGTAFASAWSDSALLFLGSGLVLLAFSARVLRRVLVLGEAIEHRGSLATTYGGAVAFGFLNPITPILFAAATPTLLAGSAAPAQVLVAGVFLGSFGWWVVLTATVSVFRRRLTCRSLNVVNKSAGLMLAAVAVGMIAKGLSTIG